MPCPCNKLANHLALTYPNKQDKPEKYEQDKLYLEKMFPDDKFSREQHFPPSTIPNSVGNGKF
ncbi:hypothetical protein H4Q26_016671 [Puccinia striiformis f. sp. tritici PST-130]|nr:hypothetical protein H4Q26_016671 [Puccinia striiformis f. sp. tritici PST-130]